MEISNITTLLIAIYGGMLTVIFLKSLKKYHKINLHNSLNKERLSSLIQENDQQRDQIKELDKENRELISCKGAFEQLQKNNEGLRLDLKSSNQNIENLQNKLAQAEKNQGLIEQQKNQLKKENENWESQKTTIINKISAEILKTNEESQNKISEKQSIEIKQITSDLLKKFETVDRKVKSMNDDLEKSMLDVDLTKNALLNPGSAGRMAELTLENILKASGLKQKKNIADDGDFILQPYIIGETSGHGKRPDAMVFLPKDQILIIDSKSSSYFLQLQQNCQNGDKNAKKEIIGKIKERIKSHINDLKNEIIASIKSRKSA
ncbi:DNA recombination protein RmuC [Flavobacteriaceae bacterium]|nr:DNA recombination protein RmuC [Flavobacteriaceae bacterium]